MAFHIIATLFLAAGLANVGTAQTSNPNALIDYEEFDQVVKLKTLRAGTHDAGGKNRYYFVVTLEASAREKAGATAQPPPTDQTTTPAVIIHALGRFGEVELAPLSYLKVSKNDPVNDQLVVDGEDLRRAFAETMVSQKVTESDVEARVVISLFEIESYFGLVGEDRLIHRFSYDPMQREAQDLSYRDQFGAEVVLAVIFEAATS